MIRLRRPTLSRGKSCADALRLRRTVREISDKRVPAQLLSNLLLAAKGINRPRGPFGGRGVTAASASNSQEIDVYVALEEGAYRFDAQGVQETTETSADHRVGGDPFTKGVTPVLVFGTSS